MVSGSSRRRFLSCVSRGTLMATLGPALTVDLGLASRGFCEDATEPAALEFGDLEPLVRLLQESAPEALQPVLVGKIRDGLDLKTLTAAAALANARTFGGEDYIGFHTFMALSPALSMSSLMPKGQEALPILKVLFRNSGRITEFGGRESEVLRSLPPSDTLNAAPQALHDAVRSRDIVKAERILSETVSGDPRIALEALLPCVQDNPEVHRTVLPWRAWDMQRLVGVQHALTFLRQSLHYCIRAEPHRNESWSEHGRMLVRLFDEFRLEGKSPGTRAVDDQMFLKFSETLSSATPEDAARAVAGWLADGIDPAVIGETLSHAASHLVLRDGGRLPQWEDRFKVAGSVHGDSVGVHASDSANAWRNMANVCQGNSRYACLIIGAWQLARDRDMPGNLLKESLPSGYQINRLTSNDPAELLRQLEGAIRDNLQGHATAIAHRYGQLQLPAEQIFSVLLKYAVSEDGALHAEKYFHTVRDDFQATREAARWQHVVALARVTASECGRPAPGQAEARQLLGVS